MTPGAVREGASGDGVAETGARAAGASADAPADLRRETGEVHRFRAADDVELRLTRCRGGNAGPVVLSHCIGVSSRMFSTPHAPRSLLEYLHGHGYDVWLLDHRLSIDLPSATQLHPLDEVARLDYPAAVDEVREITGADSVHVVAHGVGASTLTMSILSGLEGVRSAVFSQVSTHLLVAPLAQLSAHLRANRLLALLGRRWLTPRVDEDPGLVDRLVGRLLDRYPLEAEEECGHPVCHRITGMYGLMWEHDRLAEGVHEHLGSLFGPANLDALSQLSLMARRRHLVDRRGREVYLPHLGRMDMPTLLLHGSENMCVLPRSTGLTARRLEADGGPGLHRRTVIPGYGHVDCILGETAHEDVFPHVLEHLEAPSRRDAGRPA